MAPFYKWVARLQPLNGIPHDQSENTFYTDNLGGTTVSDAIKAFYTALTGTFAKSVLDGGNNLLIDEYSKTLGTELDWGPPDTTHTYSVSGIVAASSAPQEISLCLSFHGDLTGVPEFGPSTRPRMSRRGRVFIGPLSQGSLLTDTTTGVCRPQTATRTTLANAGGILKTALTGKWCVYSHKLNEMFPVTGGWVDDEFDIQRRRERKPTARSTF